MVESGEVLMKKKKQIRAYFREAVFTRDEYTCVMCGLSGVDAHHITDRNEMPNGGYVKENGITLCEECHLLAEQYHINNGEQWEKGYHPDDLYKKIKSSYQLAYKQSEKLK